jgi:hypothetical protein
MIGFQSGTGGYGAMAVTNGIDESQSNANTSIIDQSNHKMMALESEGNVDVRSPEKQGFFMTETDNFRYDQSPRG